MTRQKGHVVQDDSDIPRAYPVMPRSEQIEYLPWKELVLAGRREAGEVILKKLYADGWEPYACREMMDACDLFGAPKARKKYRKVALDMEVTKKRMAAALHKECARLLARNQTPDAREFTLQTQANCREQILTPN